MNFFFIVKKKNKIWKIEKGKGNVVGFLIFVFGLSILVLEVFKLEVIISDGLFFVLYDMEIGGEKLFGLLC